MKNHNEHKLSVHKTLRKYYKTSISVLSMSYNGLTIIKNKYQSTSSNDRVLCIGEIKKLPYDDNLITFV